MFMIALTNDIVSIIYSILIFHLQMFIAFYSVFIGVNVYCCFIVLRIKNYCIEKVVEGCERNISNVSEDQFEKDEMENVLRSHIQWGDIAELAFGKFFGRLLTESSLLVFVLTTGTAQMCGVRLIGALVRGF